MNAFIILKNYCMYSSADMILKQLQFLNLRSYSKEQNIQDLEDINCLHFLKVKLISTL